jgi:hypothetical protein
MRVLLLTIAMMSTPAFAQDATMPAEAQQPSTAASLEQDFVTAANACLGRVLGEGDLGAFGPASDAVRAGHPFGREPGLLEFSGRADGSITARSPDARTCSVFAVGAPPAASFELLSAALQSRGGFTELEVRRQEEGRLQRTFRSADGRTRVELEGFFGGEEVVPGASNLSMAHIGRRR